MASGHGCFRNICAPHELEFGTRSFNKSSTYLIGNGVFSFYISDLFFHLLHPPCESSYSQFCQLDGPQSQPQAQHPADITHQLHWVEGDKPGTDMEIVKKLCLLLQNITQ